MTLRFRCPDIKLQRVVVGSLWLLCHFGGIGSRTRRTFGSIRVDALFPVFDELQFDTQADREFFRSNLQTIERHFRVFAESVLGHGNVPISLPANSFTSFTSFALWDARLITKTGWNRQEVQDEAGRMLRGFRTGLLSTKPASKITFEDTRFTCTSDYKNIVSPYMNWKEGEENGSGLATPLRLSHNDLRNDALGLPYTFFSSSRGARVSSSVQWLDISGEKHDRRASPLFLRPLELSDGNVALLVAFFISQYLPLNAIESLTRFHTDPIEINPVADVKSVVALKSELFALLSKQYPATYGKSKFLTIP